MARREFLAAAAAPSLAAAEAGARIVAVGDVHGDLDRFVDVLIMAGMVDDRGRWTGGQNQLVQIGDVTDRGSQSPQVIDLLIRLEREAKQAQGRVWCLIGNHEALRMRGELMYCAPGEYEFFKTSKSEKERERYFQRELAMAQAEGDVTKRSDLSIGYRQRWEKQHPLGQSELIQAFAPKGRYGKWILQQRVALKLGDSLFVHAGISPKYAEWSETRFNDRIKGDIVLPAASDEGSNLAQDPEGPLWWRGFAQSSEDALAGHVAGLLKKHGVRRIVVGHTPTGGAGIVSRMGGQVILTDVGLSQFFGARRACLVIENGEAYALDRGVRTQLK